MLFIFLLLTLCVARKINRHSQEYNIFTIQEYNESLNNIKTYNYNDITKYKLDIDHHVNMYSLFTKSYFERCHNYNDNNCDYTIEEQEIACKTYLTAHPSPNEYPNNVIIKRNIYYYGIYNNQIYNYVVRPDGSTIKLDKYETLYETKGMYIIEDLLYSENYLSIDPTASSKFKLHTYINEPDDFHRRMMIYLVYYNNKTIFCPYWEIKPDYLRI